MNITDLNMLLGLVLGIAIIVSIVWSLLDIIPETEFKQWSNMFDELNKEERNEMLEYARKLANKKDDK